MKLNSVVFYSGFFLLTFLMGFINLFGNVSLRIISGAFLSLVTPGVSIYFIFSPKKIKLIDIILLVTGLSLSVLILGGLLLSVTRNVTQIQSPLSQPIILIALLIFSFICHLTSAVIHPKQIFELKIPWKVLGGGVLLFVFNLATVIGAFQLNSNESTQLPFLILIVFPLVSGLFLFFHQSDFTKKLIPLYLYFLAVSLQWALSLRSWHISGFDISTEYKVFMLTQKLGYWDINTFTNAYNACLSITVLPTVLSNLIPISTEYIFKALFPLLFALVPVIIYRIWSRLFTPIAGFTSSVFFLSFPWFIDPLTTILRQEIAFLFFALMLFLLFNDSLPKWLRYFCFYFFTTALVLSHYSTTYASISLFGIAFAVNLFILIVKRIPYIKKWFVNRSAPILGNHFKDFSLISFIFLIYFCSITFFWNVVITKTQKNIQDVINKTYQTTFSGQTNIYSGMISEIKNMIGKKTVVDPYANFQAQKIKEFTDKYPQASIPIQRADITPRFSVINEIKYPKIFAFAQKIYKYLSLFAAALPFFAGIIAILGFRIKELKEQKWISNLWISVYVLIAAIIVVPFISLGYNFERLFMHTLLLTAISPALIVIMVNKILKKSWILYGLVLSFIFIFYTFNYGLVWHVLGGKPVMWLNNKGISYDLTYTHSTEVAVAEFLMKKGSSENIHTSSKGRNILTAYGNPKSLNSDTISLLVIPGTYIFAHDVNVKQKMDYFTWLGSQTAFTYQSDDFNKRFNLVYSNGSASLYK